MKKFIKPLVYVLPVIVFMVGATLITKFAAHKDIILAVSIGVISGLGANVVARLVWHIVRKDLDESFLASEVWYAIVVGLVAWLVFNTSSAIQTMLVFGLMTAIVNAFGFRFISEPRETDAPILSRKEKIMELAKTLRYKYMEDGKTPNLNEPLCVDADGNHLTPVEADAQGLGSIYAEAIEYIKTIV